MCGGLFIAFSPREPEQKAEGAEKQYLTWRRYRPNKPSGSSISYRQFRVAAITASCPAGLELF